MDSDAFAVVSNRTVPSLYEEAGSDLSDSPRSAASLPASSAPSSPPDSPRQADVAPAELTLTSADIWALAESQQWDRLRQLLQDRSFLWQQRRKAKKEAAVKRWAQFSSTLLRRRRADALALAALQRFEHLSAVVCRQRAAAAADEACSPPLSIRQAPNLLWPPSDQFIPQHMSLIKLFTLAMTLLDRTAACKFLSLHCAAHLLKWGVSCRCKC